MRNRLFGFGYYEGHRNTTGVTQNLVVLSDAQRRGDFGTTTIRDPRTGQPFPNNVIPADRIDPAAAQLIERVRAGGQHRAQPLGRLARRRPTIATSTASASTTS